jgi:hypothetical protein
MVLLKVRSRTGPEVDELEDGRGKLLLAQAGHA